MLYVYQAASNWAAAEATRRGLDVTPQLCREILGKSVTETKKRREVYQTKHTNNKLTPCHVINR